MEAAGSYWSLIDACFWRLLETAGNCWRLLEAVGVLLETAKTLSYLLSKDIFFCHQ
jgi:hypothetical protein